MGGVSTVKSNSTKCSAKSTGAKSTASPSNKSAKKARVRISNGSRVLVETCDNAYGTKCGKSVEMDLIVYEFLKELFYRRSTHEPNNGFTLSCLQNKNKAQCISSAYVHTGEGR